MNAYITEQSDYTFTTYRLEIPQFETTICPHDSSFPKISPKRQIPHQKPRFTGPIMRGPNNQKLNFPPIEFQPKRKPKQNSDPNQHSLIKSPPNQMKSSFQKRRKDDSKHTQIDPNNKIEGKRHSNTIKKKWNPKRTNREIERKKQETKRDSFDNRTLPLADAMTTTQSWLDRPARRSRIYEIGSNWRCSFDGEMSAKKRVRFHINRRFGPSQSRAFYGPLFSS